MSNCFPPQGKIVCENGTSYDLGANEISNCSYPQVYSDCMIKGYVGQSPNASQLQSLQRLDNSECLRAFGLGSVGGYRSVLLVSNATNDTDSVLKFLGPSSYT